MQIARDRRERRVCDLPVEDGHRERDRERDVRDAPPRERHAVVLFLADDRFLVPIRAAAPRLAAHGTSGLFELATAG
jgi:hypothetical protein